MDGRTDGSSFHVAQPRLISGESLFLSGDRKEEIHPSLCVCVCVRGLPKCLSASRDDDEPLNRPPPPLSIDRSPPLRRLLFLCRLVVKKRFPNGNLFHCIIVLSFQGEGIKCLFIFERGEFFLF